MTAASTAESAGNAARHVSRHVTAQDGLRLHVRDYGPRFTAALPVVCLPGLARSGADFHALAGRLLRDPATARRIVCLDLRGRGGSDYDRDPKNYNLAVELSDLLAMLSALEIGRAIFVGTSRGGILSMLLATVRPGAIAGCVLNDIGPVIDPKGLARIKSYVGKLPQPRSFEEAAHLVRQLFNAQFPKLSAGDWMEFARRTFKSVDGRLVPDYDPKLATILAGVDLERALPALWREFDALALAPVLVVRGANSDILTTATVQAMRARKPQVQSVEVPDEGHAPLLDDDPTVERIVEFAALCDGRRRH